MLHISIAFTIYIDYIRFPVFCNLLKFRGLFLQWTTPRFVIWFCPRVAICWCPMYAFVIWNIGTGVRYSMYWPMSECTPPPGATSESKVKYRYSRSLPSVVVIEGSSGFSNTDVNNLVIIILAENSELYHSGPRLNPELQTRHTVAVNEGESAFFYCSFDGYPSPVIQW